MNAASLFGHKHFFPWYHCKPEYNLRWELSYLVYQSLLPAVVVLWSIANTWDTRNICRVQEHCQSCTESRIWAMSWPYLMSAL
jgi:hypothetical protein